MHEVQADVVLKTNAKSKSRSLLALGDPSSCRVVVHIRDILPCRNIRARFPNASRGKELLSGTADSLITWRLPTMQRWAAASAFATLLLLQAAQGEVSHHDEI